MIGLIANVSVESSIVGCARNGRPPIRVLRMLDAKAADPEFRITRNKVGLDPSAWSSHAKRVSLTITQIADSADIALQVAGGVWIRMPQHAEVYGAEVETNQNFLNP